MNEELKATLEWLKECGNNDYIFETGNCKMLLDYITNLQQRIEKAVEYINHLSKEPNVFGHYGIHNDCAKWLLKILNGRSDKK